MQRLIFGAAAVRRVVEHTISAPAQRPRTARDPKTGQLFKKPVTAPSVLLVCDHGVYLMSNGEPRDIVSEPRSFVAYAMRCDPFQDPDWRSRARELLQGDDFSFVLPRAHDLLALVDAGAQTVVLNFEDGTVEIAIG